MDILKNILFAKNTLKEWELILKKVLKRKKDLLSYCRKIEKKRIKLEIKNLTYQAETIHSILNFFITELDELNKSKVIAGETVSDRTNKNINSSNDGDLDESSIKI